MKNLANVFVGAALVAVLGFAGTAQAGPGEKGIFEAPMVIDTTGDDVGTCTNTAGECDGSEGKVEGNGDWKVEINGVPDLGGGDEYEVCLVHTGGAVSLATGLVPEADPGELKATEGDGISVPSATYQRPSLVVVEDNDAAGCSTDILFESGFAL